MTNPILPPNDPTSESDSPGESKKKISIQTVPPMLLLRIMRRAAQQITYWQKMLEGAEGEDINRARGKIAYWQEKDKMAKDESFRRIDEQRGQQ